ncbi:ATP-binding protein [Streptomyces venezuelae]|uniref:ATP-binding protein n=1 Tax=Streptomyces venezuelae TaxID=54571 RepID=UPI0034417AC5
MSPVAAVAAEGTKPMPLSPNSFDRTIPPEPVRVAEIRHQAADRMEGWAVPASVVESVTLVLSELVTNAVVHGEGDIHVVMHRQTAGLHLEVSDESATRPVLKSVHPDALHGRGLFLVRDFCDSWGIKNDGRTTWANFRCTAGRS